MHGMSPRRRQAERQAHLERATRYDSRIASGLLSRDEWVSHARELADRDRQLREAGLVDAEPGERLRERLRATIRRLFGPLAPAKLPRSTSGAL